MTQEIKPLSESEIDDYEEQLSSLIWDDNLGLNVKRHLESLIATIRQLQGENKKVMKALENIVDSAGLEFSDPRISYETWQLEPGAIQAAREILTGIAYQQMNLRIDSINRIGKLRRRL